MSALPVPPSPAPVHALDFDVMAALVARAFPEAAGRPLAQEAMPGGASTRRYFRVSLSSGFDHAPAKPETCRPRTAVAMFVPDGAKPEEAAQAHGGARWPFLEVRDLLASRGVDVPTLHGEDTARGWLLLEDLGDATLAVHLAGNPGDRERLYVQAVRDLARAQGALDVLPAGSVVSTRAFDEQLLLWEIHHFREWALDARGIALSAADRETFDGVASRLARRIASWPRSFVHRDYQSRNLMVRPGGGLCWIDFQDALLGPRVYDLVALLNDSYQVFDRTFVEARLDDYALARGLGAGELAAIVREFDLVTVQRKLKDAGRFVFIDRVKGNPKFLEFVEPTIAKVRASLARLADDEDMRALAGVLSRAIP